MVKLGARDRAQLVVIAYESGLVRPGWPGPVAGTGVRVIGQLRGDGSPAVQKSVIS